MNPNFDGVRAAIETAFQTAWAVRVGGALEVEYAGMAAQNDRVETVSWLRFNLQIGAGRKISVGSPALNRWVGQVIVQIFTPLDTGGGAGFRLGDEVATILSDRQLQGGGVIRLLTASTTYVGKDRWLQHNVSIPFNFDRAG